MGNLPGPERRLRTVSNGNQGCSYRRPRSCGYIRRQRSQRRAGRSREPYHSGAHEGVIWCTNGGRMAGEVAANGRFRRPGDGGRRCGRGGFAIRQTQKKICASASLPPAHAKNIARERGPERNKNHAAVRPEIAFTISSIWGLRREGGASLYASINCWATAPVARSCRRCSSVAMAQNASHSQSLWLRDRKRSMTKSRRYGVLSGDLANASKLL
jgi:hypothetical protein